MAGSGEELKQWLHYGHLTEDTVLGRHKLLGPLKKVTFSFHLKRIKWRRENFKHIKYGHFFSLSN